MDGKGIGGRVLPVVGLVCLVGVLGFCGFYMLSGYEHLVEWYRGLDDCFYRSEDWGRIFFTAHIKSRGNLYCMVAGVMAVVGCVAIVRGMRRRREVQPLVISFDGYDLLCAGICVAVTVALWFWGKGLVAASNDEVFSALNCAGMHPFQTASYYMLPNNHLAFNVLNNLVFHWAGDKVETGRVISLVCYSSIIVVVFFWLKGLFENRWVALLVALTMALQFPTWGFGFQARGYELLTLAAWVAFISYFKYLLAPDKKWLGIHAAAIAVGYFCVPSFLYFHGAIVVFGFVWQVVNKKADWQFWKYQGIAVGVTFLLYLPALCFSGFKALTGNPYVVVDQTYKDLVGQAIPMFQNYMDYCFFSVITKNHEVDTVLFLLPVCLLFYRKNRIARLLGVFYVAMWGVCALLTVKMKLFPIDRALTAQFSITLALVVYAVYLLKTSFAKVIKLQWLPYVLLPVFLVVLGVNYVEKGRVHVSHYLCHFTVNGWCELINSGVKTIPKGSAVAFSESAFYWYYLCKAQGYQVSKCLNGKEDYFIKSGIESFPVPGMAERYEPVGKAGDFIIYKRGALQ
jgi:hypothetical protein